LKKIGCSIYTSFTIKLTDKSVPIEKGENTTIFNLNLYSILYQARKVSGHLYVLGVSVLPISMIFSIGLWNCFDIIYPVCAKNILTN